MTHLLLCVRSFMADSWASRQRRSTESEADAEAFRRDLDGGDDFRLDEVATLSDNNRVSWQICNIYCLFSSLASQSIGQSPEVTLYLYQLWRHIYTNDDVRAIGQSIGTQVCH